MQYILACEDYEVFHDFMYAANRDAHNKAMNRFRGGGGIDSKKG